jgi:hypothetical protein
VWHLFGFDFTNHDPFTFDDLLRHGCTTPAAATIITAILWNVWKRRNALVFNLEDEPLTSLARRCLDDVRLWAHRCRSTLKELVADLVYQLRPPIGYIPPFFVSLFTCNLLLPLLVMIRLYSRCS